MWGNLFSNPDVFKSLTNILLLPILAKARWAAEAKTDCMSNRDAHE